MRGGGVSGRTSEGGSVGRSSGLKVCDDSGAPSTGMRARLGDVCAAKGPVHGVSDDPNVLDRACGANGEETAEEVALALRLVGEEASIGNWMKTSLPVGWPRASERLMLLALLGARMVLLPSAGVRLCECAETPAVEGGRRLMETSHLISPSVSVQATATSYAVPSRLPSVSDCD
jgi:hypothetical protein